MGQKQMNW